MKFEPWRRDIDFEIRLFTYWHLLDSCNFAISFSIFQKGRTLNVSRLRHQINLTSFNNFQMSAVNQCIHVHTNVNTAFLLLHRQPTKFQKNGEITGIFENNLIEQHTTNTIFIENLLTRNPTVCCYNVIEK